MSQQAMKVGSLPLPYVGALRTDGMVRRRRARAGDRAVVGALVLAYALAIVLACVIGVVIRQNLGFVGTAPELPGTVVQSSAIIGLGWMLALVASGAVHPRHISSGADIYRLVMVASVAAVGLVGVVLFLADMQLSRIFFGTLFGVGTLLLLLVSFCVRRVVNTARTRGRLRSQMLVVGSTGHVRGIVRTLSRETWLGYDVVGAVMPLHDRAQAQTDGVPVLGDESRLLELVREQQPDVVLFTAGSSASAEEFRRVAWELEELDVDVIVVPGISEISGDRIRMRPVAGLPLVHMDLPRARKALRWTKRAFDVAASSLLLLLLAPVLIVVALSVWWGDRGGVVFRQQRVGRMGETFEFLKFRSMVVDAEKLRADLELRDRDKGNTVLFKMADDPRVTRVGRLLRRYSLDELPQLWNVLRGDMSLVGPRPALPSEVSGYDIDAHRRLAVRPGITGLWQVSGRSDLSWEDTVRLDLFYVDNWSFTQDLLILFRTARAVLASRGAY
jgi:exopolysaccharide biosynthesis polyprenyl glycosylphosphotransferase